MRPVDPRLLRYSRSTRSFLVIAVLIGTLSAVLVIAQAWLLSTTIVDVAQGRAVLSNVTGVLLALGVVIVLRAILAWGAEAAAFRASARAKSDLREAAIEHTLRLGPLGPASTSPGKVAALVTRGVDALDAYYARYLPQLVLAVIVPVAVIATVITQDIISAGIIAVTLPIIVVFMILIGLYTRSRVDRQWRTLSRLSGHFLDLVAGLTTLRVLGRAKAQARAIRDIGDRYRSTTMGVLRISFLSSFALELLASLSVALVAVTIGVRLAEGGVSFAIALFILILAPEAYLPLRLVGQHFHAAAEGLGAADEVFAILETPLPASGTRADLPAWAGVEVDAVSVTYADRDRPALAATSATIAMGSVTALVGASGGGKSTLLSALLGFVPTTAGRITLLGTDGTRVDLTDIDVERWRTHIGWVPQAPHLVAPDAGPSPTVSDVVRVGRPDASMDDIRAALDRAGVLDEIEAMPDGLRTVIGEDGAGLSAGQRRRVALARALVRQADLLLLDEPTAALDGASEEAVVRALRAAADAGQAVVVVAHRAALLQIADLVVHVGGLPAATTEEAPESTATRATITGGGW